VFYWIERTDDTQGEDKRQTQPVLHDERPPDALTKLPSDPKKQFLTDYDGGDCFFITPEKLSDDPRSREVDGLGSSIPPFEVLGYEFHRQFGVEPAIGLNQVTPEQCPAVNFLFRTRNQPGAAPRLDIETAGLREDAPKLDGTVTEFGDRHLELLLIADDGFVSNITARLKPISNGQSFSFRMKKNAGPACPQFVSACPQLMFAIASSKSLAALKLPPDGVRAEQVFPQLLTEAAQQNVTLKASAKIFGLEKVP
jgi:eukaryotic-like serine/threonine-protein kinase